MDVLRSTIVLLGILAVTGCHHGYHHGDPGWCGPGYGACVPPEEGYYDGWAMPSAPWDMDPRMSRRDRHRPRRAKKHGHYPPYGPEVVHGMPWGPPACDVCDTCGVSGGAGMVMAGGVMAGSPCGCQSDAMPAGVPTGMMSGPVTSGAPCQSCQEQHVHHGMHPTPDSPPPTPAGGPTPNCAHCNETTQWQQFPSAPAASSGNAEQYYVPSTDAQAPGPLPQQKAGEPVQPVMWVPSSFDGR
ncbi:hypothetical protein Mal4_24530 [Maioricimonas rarisocia]|uniref:Uncharacterized protein n=1 Tax=Maioricimonas rarisocia TaxID=2528026 RepID=A0A517Z6T5_9PLAN|nr:hypothetical protein [Maioricimonas rarisocia]QDU38131.1 hypothetical protein Mal4_24530 [Maioricimonas rarisocia]